MIKLVSSIILAANILFSCTAVSSSQIQLYIRQGNIYEQNFEFSHETMILICNDGQIYTFTNGFEDRVMWNRDQLLKLLAERGLGLSDIVMMCHNHIMMPRFSDEDIKTYRSLREAGFRGLYQMYHNPTGKVLTLIVD